MLESRFSVTGRQLRLLEVGWSICQSDYWYVSVQCVYVVMCGWLSGLSSYSTEHTAYIALQFTHVYIPSPLRR